MFGRCILQTIYHIEQQQSKLLNLSNKYSKIQHPKFKVALNLVKRTTTQIDIMIP